MPDPVQITGEERLLAARTLLGEAGGEGYVGQLAVGWVIRTRAFWQPAAWWGSSVRNVCLGADQFQCWSDPEKQARLNAMSPSMLAPQLSIVDDVMGGRTADPTHGSTHYYAPLLCQPPKFALGRKATALIGKQLFFRIGPAG